MWPFKLTGRVKSSNCKSPKFTKVSQQDFSLDISMDTGREGLRPCQYQALDSLSEVSKSVFLQLVRAEEALISHQKSCRELQDIITELQEILTTVYKVDIEHLKTMLQIEKHL